MIRPYSGSARAHVHKRVGENRNRQKKTNLLSIVVATSRNMTSVQGGKILAGVRTDSFHLGPLRPGNQHTSTPLTDNQHTSTPLTDNQHMFRWQQPRRVDSL